MYRKRRRSTGVWLPSFGSEVTADVLTTGFQAFNLSLDNIDGIKTQVLALLPDIPVEDSNDINKSMADAIGSEYFLRRIVGKFHCAVTGITGTPINNIVNVALGFFAARADPITPEVPIGCDQAEVFSTNDDEEAFDSYSPLALSAIRQPWIWRRTWLLQHNDNGTTPMIFPSSTSMYGSVMDGPHIDAKTKRRVRNDERLYMALAMSGWNPSQGGEPAAGTIRIDYNLDLRFFGSLRKARQKGAF